MQKAILIESSLNHRPGTDIWIEDIRPSRKASLSPSNHLMVMLLLAFGMSCQKPLCCLVEVPLLNESFHGFWFPVRNKSESTFSFYHIQLVFGFLQYCQCYAPVPLSSMLIDKGLARETNINFKPVDTLLILQRKLPWLFITIPYNLQIV